MRDFYIVLNYTSVAEQNSEIEDDCTIDMGPHARNYFLYKIKNFSQPSQPSQSSSDSMRVKGVSASQNTTHLTQISHQFKGLEIFVLKQSEQALSRFGIICNMLESSAITNLCAKINETIRSDTTSKALPKPQSVFQMGQQLLSSFLWNPKKKIKIKIIVMGHGLHKIPDKIFGGTQGGIPVADVAKISSDINAIMSQITILPHYDIDWCIKLCICYAARSPSFDGPDTTQMVDGSLADVLVQCIRKLTKKKFRLEAYFTSVVISDPSGYFTAYTEINHQIEATLRNLVASPDHQEILRAGLEILQSQDPVMGKIHDAIKRTAYGLATHPPKKIEQIHEISKNKEEIYNKKFIENLSEIIKSDFEASLIPTFDPPNPTSPFNQIPLENLAQQEKIQRVLQEARAKISVDFLYHYIIDVMTSTFNARAIRQVSKAIWECEDRYCKKTIEADQ